MQTVDSVPVDNRISVSIIDASTMTGLSRSRIYELIAENKIRTTCVGRRRLVLV